MKPKTFKEYLLAEGFSEQKIKDGYKAWQMLLDEAPANTPKTGLKKVRK